MPLPIHTDLWPLFYTGRMRACALVGIQAEFHLGPDHATGAKRAEAIQITRVAFTTVGEMLPEDVPQCGFLNQAAFQRELERQKPELTDADPVTVIYFRRRMEDR